MAENNALFGEVVIMETQTGEIKAIVQINRRDSLNYQILSNLGESRETGLMKPISMLAAMETGKIKLSDTVNVGNGIYSIYGRVLGQITNANQAKYNINWDNNVEYIQDFCGYYPTNDPLYTVFISVTKRKDPENAHIVRTVLHQLVKYRSQIDKN